MHTNLSHRLLERRALEEAVAETSKREVLEVKKYEAILNLHTRAGGKLPFPWHNNEKWQEIHDLITDRQEMIGTAAVMTLTVKYNVITKAAFAAKLSAATAAAQPPPAKRPRRTAPEEQLEGVGQRQQEDM